MGWSGGTFTRTDGTRTGTAVWADAEAASVNILSADHDTHDQDLAGGINATRALDGTNTATANLPMGGFRHTSVGNATARNGYPSVAQLQDGAVDFATTTGSANAYVLALAPALTAYATGQKLYFKASFVNTGSATINVNAVGAKTIKDAHGNALKGGEIQSGGCYLGLYDGTDVILVNSGVPAIGGASIRVHSLTLSDNTDTQITWAAADEDWVTDSTIADDSGDRLIAPVGSSLVLLVAGAHCSAADTDEVAVHIIKGATTWGGSTQDPATWMGQSEVAMVNPANYFGATVSVIDVVDTPGTDYYKMWVKHKDAGATAAQFSCNFTLLVLR
jgi:hypothetical protein